MRKSCCEKEGLNRGAWSKHEDQKLIDYIKAHGEGCWRSLPKAAGLHRCGKSCRLRWINYLRPDIKRGNFAQDEEDLIIKLHALLGNSSSLLGRTQEERTMGNSIGGSKKAEVMKINGEYFKLKTPARAADVLKDYPTHVLLDSDEFLRFNLRAPPLEPEDQLKPKKVYLLFELPKFPGSGIAFRSVSLSAKDRLDLLMSSRRRRSVSDLSVAKKSAREFVDHGSRPVRVKVRLPRGQVERIIKESKDEVEMAEKIVDLCAGGASGGNRVARRW